MSNSSRAKMSNSDTKPRMSLKDVLETASQQVAESPEWLKEIYKRNDALLEQQHRSQSGERKETESMNENAEEVQTLRSELKSLQKKVAMLENRLYELGEEDRMEVLSRVKVNDRVIITQDWGPDEGGDLPDLTGKSAIYVGYDEEADYPFVVQVPGEPEPRWVYAIDRVD